MAEQKTADVKTKNASRLKILYIGLGVGVALLVVGLILLTR